MSSLLENPNHFDILEDDQALINKSFNSTGNSAENDILDKRINLTPLPQETVSYTKSSNYDIIDRALSKTQLPKIKVNIDWGSKEPQKEIQLLIEVMDISISEIVEWYISKFNMGEVKDNVHTCIEKLLYNKYNTDVDQDSVDKPTKTKTKTQKTLK